MAISKIQTGTFHKGHWYQIELTDKWYSEIPLNMKFAVTYIIFTKNREKCLYIGQTSNLTKRLKTHIRLINFQNNWLTKWGSFAFLNIAFRIERYKYERLAIEAKFIDRLNPLFNKLPPGVETIKT